MARAVENVLFSSNYLGMFSKDIAMVSTIPLTDVLLVPIIVADFDVYRVGNSWEIYHKHSVILPLLALPTIRIELLPAAIEPMAGSSLEKIRIYSLGYTGVTPAISSSIVTTLSAMPQLVS